MKQKTIPQTLKIGEHDYKIVVTDVLAESVSGACHIYDKLILIDIKLSKSDLMATLAHEILHAIEQEAGIDLGHPKINKMEYMLAQVFEQIMPKPKPKKKRRKT